MEQQPAIQSTIPFQFDGKATEYFGIWIVNILLTIITIGIYTAWAKVRTNRYFYGKTRIFQERLRVFKILKIFLSDIH